MRKTQSAIGMLICSAVLAAAGLGCAGTKVQFIDAPVAKLDLTQGRDIQASASGFQLLLFIPISINDRMERAYDSLMAKGGRNHVAEISVQESWTYALVGTVYTTTLTARAYPEVAAPVGAATPTPARGQ
jgi:hypothetical protein